MSTANVETAEHQVESGTGHPPEGRPTEPAVEQATDPTTESANGPGSDPGPTEPPGGPAAPSGPPGPPRQGRWHRPATWLAVLAAVLLVTTVLAAVGWTRARNDAGGLQHSASLRASALHAAREYAVDLTTYDYRHLGRQQRTLKQESTKKFQKSFAKSNKSLAPIFTQLKASAKGKVVDAAVRTASDTGAVVLLFVDQVARSTKLDKPQTQPSRLRMRLVRQDGRWLMDRVDLVP